eukprot:TRINITY_DN5766_c0_g2_i1.p2 TRINITY_DN5766_c0_g2~~TRINITY_DN5766_c0_g2_i1.p2  ORF type:complete len:197 (+),score=56.12 TRINITY_DN5766_c0_g2_i1:125-715(+)
MSSRWPSGAAAAGAVPGRPPAHASAAAVGCVWRPGDDDRRLALSMAPVAAVLVAVGRGPLLYTLAVGSCVVGLLEAFGQASELQLGTLWLTMLAALLTVVAHAVHLRLLAQNVVSSVMLLMLFGQAILLIASWCSLQTAAVRTAPAHVRQLLQRAVLAVTPIVSAAATAWAAARCVGAPRFLRLPSHTLWNRNFAQ